MFTVRDKDLFHSVLQSQTYFYEKYAKKFDNPSNYVSFCLIFAESQKYNGKESNIQNLISS